jgi:hypothetical protein
MVGTIFHFQNPQASNEALPCRCLKLQNLRYLIRRRSVAAELALHGRVMHVIHATAERSVVEASFVACRKHVAENN